MFKVISTKNTITSENKVFEAQYKNFNPLSTNPTNLPTNCLSVFDHFVGLALKGLKVMLRPSYSIFILFLTIPSISKL